MSGADRSRAGRLPATHAEGRPALPGDATDGTMGGGIHHDPREDDVTEPTSLPDADRAEQEAFVDPPEVDFAGDAAPPRPDVDEADALDQQLVARPHGTGGVHHRARDREADEADVLEQETDVPVEDDDTSE
jgi:hypothetical protein